MSGSKRKIFTGAQKAKVALEAVKGVKTINEIAQEYSVHQTQVSQWKKELLVNAGVCLKANEGRNWSQHRTTLTGCTPRATAFDF